MWSRPVSSSCIPPNLNTTTMLPSFSFSIFFFFNDTATTEIYTLSLHDALPIFLEVGRRLGPLTAGPADVFRRAARLQRRDRKSTRLNSSHDQISYAVFCLKKKKNNRRNKNI